MPIKQNKSYFVSPEYVLELMAGYLDNNIDVKSINTFILKAQYNNIQYILSYNLYTKYILLFTPAVPGDDTTMPIYLPENINYYNLAVGQGNGESGLNIACIMDATALWTIYHLLDWAHFRVTNKAVVTKYSQFSNAVSEPELNRLKYIVMNDAQAQSSEITKQIENYPTFYPEYFTQIGTYRPPAQTNPYDNYFISGKPGRNGFGQYSDLTTTSMWEAGYRCCD